LLSSAAPDVHEPAIDGRPERGAPTVTVLLPIYILIFIGLIYLVGVRPQQKRRKQLEDILRNLRAGDEVVTVSGIYGTVTEVEEGETLLLEIAEDIDIRVAKSSIARKVSGPEAGADVSAAADAA
jgi:preprotein translocase subunit YajC